MSYPQRVWLAWVGLTVVVGVVVNYALAIVAFRGTDLSIVMFGLGMTCSAFTVPVLRALSRRLRG